MPKFALFRDNALPITPESQEERLSLLLASSHVDKILADNQTKITAQRKIHADSILKLNAQLLEELPKLDIQIEAASARLLKATKELEMARTAQHIAVTAKASRLHRIEFERRVHLTELKNSASVKIDEAILQLRDLYFENQNLPIDSNAPSEIALRMAGRQSATYTTNERAVLAWRVQVDGAISALESLKLEYDQFTVPERIAEIIANVPDPRKLAIENVTWNLVTGEHKVEGAA